MSSAVLPGYLVPSNYPGIRVQSLICNQAGGILNFLKILRLQQISSGGWILTGGSESATWYCKPIQYIRPPHRWESGHSNIGAGR